MPSEGKGSVWVCQRCGFIGLYRPEGDTNPRKCPGCGSMTAYLRTNDVAFITCYSRKEWREMQDARRTKEVGKASNLGSQEHRDRVPNASQGFENQGRQESDQGDGQGENQAGRWSQPLERGGEAGDRGLRCEEEGCVGPFGHNGGHSAMSGFFYEGNR
jgi:hypothetical protein